MRFVDEVTVTVSGGRGGDGAVRWRREKYVPLGGPDGGNGGDGGAVVFVADSSLNTLIDFSFSPIVAASDGESGDSGGRDGLSGETLIKRVPVGTQVYFLDELVADLRAADSKWVAARGGRGGKGNVFFKSSTNRSPDFSERGEEPERFEFRLVLKSVADVGLVGLPNVGKSTLISTISRSHAKVADYPFTTLTPHLGVVLVDKDRRFVVADIPGLVPGASEGKGLGLQFLRHIERTSIIAQLIDVTTAITASEQAAFENDLSDEKLKKLALRQFEAIDSELEKFSPELARFPRIVVFTKADHEQCRRAFEQSKTSLMKQVKAVHLISAKTGEGIPELINLLYALVKSVQASG